MRVTVQIATLNRPANLAILLSSLARQTFKDWDLIVIDDSDQPGFNSSIVNPFIKMIKEEGHKLRYIWNKEKLGVGKARNMAILEDWNPLGCRIDDDSFLEPDYLERLYNVISCNKKIAAVGGTVPHTSISNIYQRTQAVGTYPDFMNGVFNRVKFNLDANSVETIDWSTYCYMEPAVLPSQHLRSSFMFRNDIAKKVGMHPENLGPTGFREESITKERFVTVRKKGMIEIKNIERLYEDWEDYESLTYNIKDKCVEWKPILKVIRHNPSNKKIYRVNQKWGETRCTEDHSLIDSDLNEVKPTELKKDLFTIREIPASSDRYLDHINLIDLFEDDEITDITSETFRVKAQGGRRDIFVPRYLDIYDKRFESLCRLLGAYIAEGSVSTRHNAFAVCSTNLKWIKNLKKDFVKLFGFEPKIEDVGWGYNLKTGVKMVGKIFKRLCGQGAKNKKLPYFVYNVPTRFQRMLLKKMIDGDGHTYKKEVPWYNIFKNNRWMYSTISLELISGLSTLLSLNGFKEYSIYYNKTKKSYYLRTYYNKNHKGHGKGRNQLYTRIHEETYNDYVYDIAVEDNHNFVDSCGQILVHNTVLCLKLAWAGYELWTDVQAKAWHMQNPVGGVRNQLSMGVTESDHNKAYGNCDEWFFDWAIRMYKKHGSPFRGWGEPNET